jgi:hypothetical protein
MANQIEFRTVSKELPVFTTNIGNHTQALRLAAEAIFEERKKNPRRMESNVKAEYVSEWGSHLNNPKFQPLIDIVLSFCEEISKTYFNCELKFKIFNCWGMLYEPGDYAVKHSHFPSTFAAVIYLDVSEDSAPIVFEEELTVIPASGSLVVFPAILHHEVPKTKARRMVISMNIDHVS